MKVSTMRSRLHEAISLATDEEVQVLFQCFPGEISRNEFLSLGQLREVTEDAEAFIRGRMEEVHDRGAAGREGGAEQEKTDREKLEQFSDFLFVLFKHGGVPAQPA